MAIIDKPSDYFNTVLYTGTGSSNAITGVGFQPDLLWFKNRSSALNHILFDSVRGIDKYFYVNLNEAEGTSATILTAVGSDGFTVGANNNVNQSSNGIVAWNWKAGTSFTNDASSTGIGTIDSTGSTNTTSGFSIVKWTSTGSTGTVAHNLGVTPKFIVVKRLEDSGYDWTVYHVNDTAGLYLNSTGVNNDSSSANIFDRSPTSTVFNITADGRIGGNTTGKNYIAYCFNDVQGYSKFGSYTGNGNANGTFVYTGFKPAFVMIKRTDSATGGYWVMFDNKRNTFNVMDKYLFAQASDAEDTSNLIDFYSNGFRPIVSNLMHNGSGASYIYMCFASNPFVSSTGVPATAR